MSDVVLGPVAADARLDWVRAPDGRIVRRERGEAASGFDAALLALRLRYAERYEAAFVEHLEWVRGEDGVITLRERGETA